LRLTPPAEGAGFVTIMMRKVGGAEGAEPRGGNDLKSILEIIKTLKSKRIFIYQSFSHNKKFSRAYLSFSFLDLER
jgi:hypothetical protein